MHAPHVERQCWPNNQKLQRVEFTRSSAATTVPLATESARNRAGTQAGSRLHLPSYIAGLAGFLMAPAVKPYRVHVRACVQGPKLSRVARSSRGGAGLAASVGAAHYRFLASRTWGHDRQAGAPKHGGQVSGGGCGIKG